MSDLEILKTCSAGQVKPTKEEVLQALARVLKGEHEEFLTVASSIQSKGALCIFLDTIFDIIKPNIEIDPVWSTNKRENQIKQPIPPTLEQTKCQEHLNKYDFKLEELGKGQYGKIAVACLADGSNCNFAVKTQTYNPSSLPTIERELYFLNYLKNVRIPEQKTHIVPLLYDAWRCPSVEYEGEGTQYIVMDRWQGDLQSRFKGKDETLYCNEDELLQMFQIARAIGEAGVVHGDLKPDQYLYRSRGPTSVDIALTDFAFAGFVSTDKGKGNVLQPIMGWSSNVGEWKCLPAFNSFPSCKEAKKGHIKTKSLLKQWFSSGDCDQKDNLEYASMLNVVQLESWFLYDSAQPYFVVDKDGLTLGVFAGLSGTPWREQFVCKAYQESVESAQKAWKNAGYRLIYLRWDKL